MVSFDFIYRKASYNQLKFLKIDFLGVFTNLCSCYKKFKIDARIKLNDATETRMNALKLDQSGFSRLALEAQIQTEMCCIVDMRLERRSNVLVHTSTSKTNFKNLL